MLEGLDAIFHLLGFLSDAFHAAIGVGELIKAVGEATDFAPPPTYENPNAALTAAAGLAGLTGAARVLKVWGWRHRLHARTPVIPLARELHPTFRQHLEEFRFIGPRISHRYLDPALAEQPYLLNIAFVPIGIWYEHEQAPAGPLILARRDEDDPRLYLADYPGSRPHLPFPRFATLDAYLTACWDANVAHERGMRSARFAADSWEHDHGQGKGGA